MLRLLLIFLFISSSNYILGQENTTECNKKILGLWELQSISKPFRQKPKKPKVSSAIWDFKNDYVIIKGVKFYYQISNGCSELSLYRNNSLEQKYIISRFDDKKLFLKKRVLAHEEYIFYFKKNK